MDFHSQIFGERFDLPPAHNIDLQANTKSNVGREKDEKICLKQRDERLHVVFLYTKKAF